MKKSLACRRHGVQQFAAHRAIWRENQPLAARIADRLLEGLHRARFRAANNQTMARFSMTAGRSLLGRVHDRAAEPCYGGWDSTARRNRPQKKTAAMAVVTASTVAAIDRRRGPNQDRRVACRSRQARYRPRSSMAASIRKPATGEMTARHRPRDREIASEVVAADVELSFTTLSPDFRFPAERDA